jgi:uncharacterized membrane protein
MSIRRRFENVLLFVLLAGVAMLALGGFTGISDTANAFLTIFLGLAFMILHGKMALGWKRLLAFAAITVAVSFTAEAAGVATGWVFGKYHYADHLGPKILGVPPFIQAGYAAMGYASLAIARIILGFRESPKGGSLVALALGGAMVMVSWDVAMDPWQSTVAGDWIWEEGGPYFGVPLHNYAGWFGTVFLFMLFYLIYESRWPLPVEQEGGPLFQSAPVLYYALVGMGMILAPWVGGLDSEIALPQNYAGSVESLGKSMTLMALFVMGTPVVMALSRLGCRR